jgi:hypothetical protein
MTTVKRCPRCGKLKAAAEFSWRRQGRQLSAYCQPCTRAAARQTQRRRRQDPTSAVRLPAVDRGRQRRHRVLRRQGGDGR